MHGHQLGATSGDRQGEPDGARWMISRSAPRVPPSRPQGRLVARFGLQLEDRYVARPVGGGGFEERGGKFEVLVAGRSCTRLVRRFSSVFNGDEP